MWDLQFCPDLAVSHIPNQSPYIWNVTTKVENQLLMCNKVYGVMQA